MDPSVFRALHADSSRRVDLREIGLLGDLTPEELRRIDQQLPVRCRRVRAGAVLFRAGDRGDALFEVQTGCFKTVRGIALGVEQVVGFQLPGELLGLDALGDERHDVDAIALEDSRAWVLPHDQLAAVGRAFPRVQERLHRSIGRELVRDIEAMVLLGSLYAEERVASFLLDLLHRLAKHAQPADRLHLGMARWEIASLLGLTVETVSRTLTRFHAAGLIVVQHREIQVTDLAGLQRILDGSAVRGPEQGKRSR